MDTSEIEKKAEETVKMLGIVEDKCETYGYYNYYKDILIAFENYFIALEWQNMAKQNDKEETKEETKKT